MPTRMLRGAFVGLQLRHDRGALVRAVLEGVAFGLRDSLDAVRGLGVDVSVGRASGGGARSALWLRIVASVLDLPLELTESEEGSAFGAALLGGVAGGVFADAHDAVSRCVRPRSVVEPEPAWRDLYAERLPEFRALYPALRPFGSALGRRLSDLLRRGPAGGSRRLTIQSYDISIGRHPFGRGRSAPLARDKEVGRCE